MSGPLESPLLRLAQAESARKAVEARARLVWRDAAERRFTDRVLSPLERESVRFRSALEMADREFAQALRLLQ